MAIIQNFNLNLIPDSAPVIVHVDQYDEGAGRLVASLYNGNTAYTPASGATAVIQGMKPDKHGFTYSATISGNTVTANLTQQMTAAAGNVCVQLVIHEGDNRTGTFVFFLAVQRSALPANSDLSQSDLEYIEELIADAEALNTQVPYIGANGHWWIWSTTAHAYVDSGVDASITITIGTTSTLPAGSSATVTNSGTPTDPIFNFGIPKGDTGATGADGADGDDGFSPYVTLGTKVGRDQPVTITDSEGDHTFHVYDGEGGSIDTFIGTCNDSGSVAAKTATVDSSFTLHTGVIISIKFDAKNYAANPTLNVNGTGAKSIWYGTGVITNTNLIYAGEINCYETYIYDGTYWVWLSHSKDADTTYTPASLGFGYGTCSTAAATAAKTVTMPNYSLTTDGIVVIKFDNAVPANATLSINNETATSIYHQGSAIADGVIKAGDTATFVYSTYYHLISIERVATADDNVKHETVAPEEISPSTAHYDEGDQLFYNGVLYVATDEIDIGDTLTVGTNISASDDLVTQIANAGKGVNTDKTMQEYQALTPEQQADPDTYYWIDDDPGIDYDNIRDIVAPTEQTTAVGNRAVGDEFILGDYLYKAISAIYAGDPIVTSGTGQNATLAGTIVQQLKTLFNSEGDLSSLTTTAKTSLVAAINELVGVDFNTRSKGIVTGTPSSNDEVTFQGLVDLGRTTFRVIPFRNWNDSTNFPATYANGIFIPSGDRYFSILYFRTAGDNYPHRVWYAKGRYGTSYPSVIEYLSWEQIYGQTLLTGTQLATTIANATQTNVASIANVPAGTYLVHGRIIYSANATGVRDIGIVTSATSGTMDDTRPATPAGNTTISSTLFLTLSSSGTIYMHGYQNSGSTLDVSSIVLQAYKLY